MVHTVNTNSNYNQINHVTDSQQQANNANTQAELTQADISSLLAEVTSLEGNSVLNLSPSDQAKLEGLLQQLQELEGETGVMDPSDMLAQIKNLAAQLKGMLAQVAPNLQELIAQLEDESRQSSDNIKNIAEGKVSDESLLGLDDQKQQSASKIIAGTHEQSVSQVVAKGQQLLAATLSAKQALTQVYANSNAVGLSSDNTDSLSLEDGSQQASTQGADDFSNFLQLSGFGSFGGSISDLLRNGKSNAIICAILIGLLVSETDSEAIVTQAATMSATTDDEKAMNDVKSQMNDLSNLLPFTPDKLDPSWNNANPDGSLKIKIDADGKIDDIYSLEVYLTQPCAAGTSGAKVPDDDAAKQAQGQLSGFLSASGLNQAGGCTFDGSTNDRDNTFSGIVTNYFDGINTALERNSPSDVLSPDDIKAFIAGGGSSIAVITNHLTTGITQAGSISTQQNAVLSTMQQYNSQALGFSTSLIDTYKTLIQYVTR